MAATASRSASEGRGTSPERSTAASDYASDGTGNSPAGDALFASADEANVDNTIPEGTAATANAGAVPKYTVGQCIDPHSATYSSANGGNNNGTSCPGIGSTRAQYTTGRLVIFSCRSGGKTLAPAQGAPACAKPVSGLFHQDRCDRGALHDGPGLERPARPYEEVLRGHRRSERRWVSGHCRPEERLELSPTRAAGRRQWHRTRRTGSPAWRRST